jgi:Zn-dependent protease
MSSGHNGGMAKSLKIARIAGTPISVNGGLVILAAMFIISLTVQGFPQIDPDASLTIRIVVATATVVAFLASILAHELGHATVAKRQGVGVLGITLSLLGGYAQLDRQAPTPRAEFSIAAAGPAVNIVIGGILAGVAYWAYIAEWASSLVLGAIIWLAGVNLVLAALNLVPAAPLDGGRVLTAALWKKFADAERARIVSGRLGLILGAIVVIVGAYQILGSQWEGLVTVIVGMFLFNGARGEIGTAAIRRRLQHTKTSELMISDPPPVADSLTMEQLRSFAGTERAGVAFPVVRWDPEPIGYVVPAAATKSMNVPERSWTTVSELMQPTPEVARAWMNEPIDDVLRRLDQPQEVLVVVHEPTGGRVVGTLSETQVSPLFAAPDIWGRDRDAASWNWRSALSAQLVD